MKSADIIAAKNELAGIIGDYLLKHSGTLGPHACTIHGLEIDECDPDCEQEPIGDVFSRSVEGFILVAAYCRDEQHGNAVLDVTPPGQSYIYTAGLVKTANDIW